MEKAPELIIALDAGIGVAAIAGYLIYKIKKAKKKLRRTILRRGS
ncbi:MAG: hypothetical protein ABIA37_03930 [Candidatus Woesearchaeota archaeon]